MEEVKKHAFGKNGLALGFECSTSARNKTSRPGSINFFAGQIVLCAEQVLANQVDPTLNQLRGQ